MSGGSIAPGAFIAIEGGEGAGKGTLLADLAARLREDGRDVLTTREPGGTPEGQALRAMLLGAEGAVWDPWAELLLMVAARVQHVRRVILPAVQAGRVVISDRYAGSTLAYQGAGRGLSMAAITSLHREAVGDVWPDLTVLLDIDPAIGLRRSLARLGEQGLDEGRFEALDLEFHQRVRACFLDQARQHPVRHAVIDASRPADVVAAQVAAAVREWLRTRQEG